MAIKRRPATKRRAPARSSLGRSFTKIIYPGYEGARDAVSGTVYALANGAALKGSAIGGALYFPGTSDNQLTLGTNAIAAAHSVVMTVLLKSTAADHCLYTSVWNATGGFHVRVTSTGVVQILIQNTSVTVASAAGAVQFGVPSTITIGFDGLTSGGRYYAAVNGREAINTTASASASFTGTAVLGDQGANGGFVTSSGWMSLWAYAPGYLGQTTLLALSKQPQRLFKAANSNRWLVPAASGTTITCTVGGAAAAGVSALVSQTLQTSVGNAAANGTTALISRSIVAGVGNAGAAGPTALISSSVVASVGNAAATGVTALLNSTLQTSVGSASANGTTALLSTSVQASVGNASALGATALLPISVQTGVGNASAFGVTATVSTAVGVTITCTVGDAGAAGTTALLNRTLQTSVGDALALGITLGSASPAVGGYDDDKPKKPKKRFVVEQDGKLLVFSSAKAAALALGQQAAIEAVSVPVAVDAPEAEEISLPAVEAYAEATGQSEAYDKALESQHYQRLLALFHDMRDEEDIELLMMLA